MLLEFWVYGAKALGMLAVFPELYGFRACRVIALCFRVVVLEFCVYGTKAFGMRALKCLLPRLASAGSQGHILISLGLKAF